MPLSRRLQIFAEFRRGAVMSTASVTFHSADKFTTIRIKFKSNGDMNPGDRQRPCFTQEDLGCLLCFASLVFVSSEEASSL